MTIRKAIWIGSDILPHGVDVDVLAEDIEDPSAEARRATWVRYWPKYLDYPVYRSCDACDLGDVEVLL